MNATPRAWLAAALRGECPPWNGDAEDGVALFACAVTEGVAALVHACGACAALPATIATEFADFERGRVMTDLPDHAELVQVVRALADAGVPALLLKGSALAYSVYPSPHLRPRVDIDLLVSDEAMMGRCRQVLEPLGYLAADAAVATLIGYQTALQRTTTGGRTHHIDAHWRPSNLAMFEHALPWNELDSAAIALPAIDPAARGLGRMHALVHACLHRIANLPAEPGSNSHGDRMVWLYDMDLLARRFAADDFEMLRRIAAARGMAGACRDGLEQAQALFATPLPEGFLRALGDAASAETFDVGKARLRWYQEWQNLRAVSPRQRLSWAREKLFPSAAYMRQTYPVDGPGSLAWAYLQRLGHGLRIALRGRD